jgi:hypothetical protein
MSKIPNQAIPKMENTESALRGTGGIDMKLIKASPSRRFTARDAPCCPAEERVSFYLVIHDNWDLNCDNQRGLDPREE